MNTKEQNMNFVDIADLFKVLGASLGAVFFAQIDLVTVMSISEALEYFVKMGVLVSSLIYTIYKIKDVRRKEERSNARPLNQNVYTNPQILVLTNANTRSGHQVSGYVLSTVQVKFGELQRKYLP